MSELHILNAGRADCNILLLDTESGRHAVVIDGGTLRDTPSPILRVLRENNVDGIDLLILTHLHQDHFGGFFHLIDQVPVRRVVAPCGDLVFCDAMYPYYANNEYFREYHAIFQYFVRCGAEMIPIDDCIGQSFSFGAHTLRCLYPTAPGRMAAAACAQRLCDPGLHCGEMENLCTEFQALCNADSSIWLLESGGRDIALFSGDCTVETMDEAITAHPCRPIVLKLSHHGIGSGRYFNADNVEKIFPQIMVVPIAKEYYNADIKKDCEAARGKTGAALHYTCEGEYCLTF